MLLRNYWIYLWLFKRKIGGTFVMARCNESLRFGWGNSPSRTEWRTLSPTLIWLYVFFFSVIISCLRFAWYCCHNSLTFSGSLPAGIFPVSKAPLQVAFSPLNMSNPLRPYIPNIVFLTFLYHKVSTNNPLFCSFRMCFPITFLNIATTHLAINNHTLAIPFSIHGLNSHWNLSLKFKSTKSLSLEKCPNNLLVAKKKKVASQCCWGGRLWLKYGRGFGRGKRVGWTDHQRHALILICIYIYIYLIFSFTVKRHCHLRCPRPSPGSTAWALRCFSNWTSNISGNIWVGFVYLARWGRLNDRQRAKKLSEPWRISIHMPGQNYGIICHETRILDLDDCRVCFQFRYLEHENK